MVVSRGSVHSGAMTITDELTPVDTPPDPPGPGSGDGLHRSSSRRMVAGVAGGLAERFDIDVTVVRVAFVVVACVWGLGVVVYLAMWALVPVDGAPVRTPGSDGTEGPADGADPSKPTGPPWLTYVLLTGALFIGLMVTSTWWGGPRWGGAWASCGWSCSSAWWSWLSGGRPTSPPSVGSCWSWR